jgi:hypothetical protein
MQNDKANASISSGPLKQIAQSISPERNSEYLVSSSATQRLLSQLSDEGEKVVLTPQMLFQSLSRSVLLANENHIVIVYRVELKKSMKDS